jgi:hypothetical protein
MGLGFVKDRVKVSSWDTKGKTGTSSSSVGSHSVKQRVNLTDIDGEGTGVQTKLD